MPNQLHNAKDESQLPESLRAQLKQFRKHLWHIKIMEAVWAGFFGLLISYGLVFALDRFIPTSGVARLLILLGGISVFAIFAPLWINRWVFKYRRENQIAQLIAKQYPKLGDRLLGVVELQKQVETDTSLSPRLREAAMAQVASEFSSRDLTNALPISWHKKWALAVLALTLLTVTAWVTSPKAGVNSLQRWIMPLAEIERYTQTVIDKSRLPSVIYVAQGEPFDIIIALSDDSNTPASAKAKLGDTPWTLSSVENREYTFSFPKSFKPKTLEVRAGDDFHSVQVTPITRPSLIAATATIQFPSYLEKQKERVDLSAGQAAIVEGATVTITGKTNRKLSRATASIIEPGDEQDRNRISTSINGSNFTLAPFIIEHDSIQVPLNWIDEHHLSNTVQTTLSIEKILDTPPSAYLENTSEALYVLADSSIQFDLSAEDDFGLKLTGLEWSGEFTKPSPHTPARGELTMSKGSPNLKSNTESIDFSFQVYDIQPQKLTIRGWAEDYKPTNSRVHSEPITVYVLTKAEHRELMEKRTQDAINQLEDLMRSEQDLLDQNKRLERLSGEELQKETGREKLAEQAQKELENTETLKAIAKKMADVFKEASKNDNIDSATLKKLAESALKMKQMAEQSMPQISKKLDEAQSKENSEQRAKDDVKEAVAKQAELLKEMQQAIKQATDANKQLQAGTFVNRLQKAAGDEEQLASALISLMQSKLGPDLRSHFSISEYASLDPVDQRSVLSLYAQQRQTGIDINWIEEDLAHFFLRTQQQEHQDLLNKMKESTITEDMGSLLQRIEKSQNYLSIDLAKQSAETLRNWAKELSKNAAKSNSSSGGGGGSSSADEEDFEFMLRVMRLIQQEDNIRSRIRSLEQRNRLRPPNSHTPPPTS